MNLPTDAALRPLDAATTTLSASEQQRAAVTLERIVSTAPSTDGPRPTTPRPARRTPRRLLLVGTAAALALAGGSVVIQGLRGGAPAYASWSATPTAVASADLDVAAAACRDRLHDFADVINPDRAKLVLAERRGDHVALLYGTDSPSASAACFARNQPGLGDVDNVDIGVGSSSGPAVKAPANGYTQDTIAQFKGASFADGAAGDAVAGVVIHAGTLTVQASVANGRYAAWWPGAGFQSRPRQPSGPQGPTEILSYDLTLTDGTVILDASPNRPSN